MKKIIKPIIKYRIIYAKYLKRILGKTCLSLILKKDQLIITVDKESLVNSFFFIKNHTHCIYKSLSELTATDFFIKNKRIEVSYHLLSIQYSDRIMIKTNIRLSDSLPSITSVFPVSNWFEREVFDIFGIFFSGHPDLRRILTDYGFEGHPLRKDFPLVG